MKRKEKRRVFSIPGFYSHISWFQKRKSLISKIWKIASYRFCCTERVEWFRLGSTYFRFESHTFSKMRASFSLLKDVLQSFFFLVSIQCHNPWQGHSQVHVQVYNGAEMVCGSLCWFKGVDSALCVTGERWPWARSRIWEESRPKTVASLSRKYTCTDCAHIPLEVIRTSLALLLTTPAPLDLSPSCTRFHLKFGSSNGCLLSCVRSPRDVTISRSLFF